MKGVVILLRPSPGMIIHGTGFSVGATLQLPDASRISEIFFRSSLEAGASEAERGVVRGGVGGCGCFGVLLVSLGGAAGCLTCFSQEGVGG